MQDEIIYQCPHCETILNISRRYAGQNGNCTHCKNEISVPSGVSDSIATIERKPAPKYKRLLKRLTTSVITMSLLSLIVGFFLGYQFKGFMLRNSSERFVASGNTASGVKHAYSQKSPAKQTATAIEKAVGELASLATIDLIINSTAETETTSPNFGNPTVAPAGARFVVVNMTLKNSLQTPFNFDPKGMRLVDEKEREFDTYNAIGKVTEYLEVRTLAPGVPEKGNLLFLLPDDALRYSFMVGKAGSSEVVKIPLK